MKRVFITLLFVFSSFFVFAVAHFFIYFVCTVERGKVNHRNGNAEKHIPERIRDKIVEKLEKRIPIVENREHVVHLNDIPCPVYDVVGNAVLVYKNVDKVNYYVRTQRDHYRGPNALFIKLDEPELKEDKRYAEFKHVREIVEHKNPARYLCRCNGRVEHERRKRTYRPEHEQVAKVFISRKHNYGKKHCVKRTKVEGQIFNW